MIAHIVALSGGKDSTAMALRLKEINPSTPFRFVITPTGNELPDMVAHWARLESLLGVTLEVVPGPKLEPLMEAQACLPSTRIRWCTRMVKIQPVEALYATLPAGSVAYVGLRADEDDREGIFGSTVIQAFPLRQWGWAKADVLAYLKARSVVIPPRTDCAFCPFQGADDWFQLWRDHLAIYLQAEAWEEKIGHTFRNPGAKLGTWAAALKDLRVQFEAGKLTREERARIKSHANPALPLFDDELAEQACRVCRM